MVSGGDESQIDLTPARLLSFDALESESPNNPTTRKHHWQKISLEL